MSEADFIRRWTEDQPQYRAWGFFVVSEMQRLIRDRLQDASVESFLRIPSKPRLKETTSLVDKAFYRGKEYRDPYQDITDKVGVRFVVLLNSDVRLIEELLLSHEDWIARKDRDYETERDEKPFVFTYQSLHYIVFAKSALEVDGIRIAENTPCEVQIRTLLQHAHSELSHSNIYKPNISATPDMLRASAKSMALIEAADDYFDHVASKSQQAGMPLEEAKAVLAELYGAHVGQAPEFAKSNTIILDALRCLFVGDLKERIQHFVANSGFIVDRIRERAPDKLLYRLPAILFLYYLAEQNPLKLKELWPLSPAELRPLFVDMGIAFDSPRR